jgi:hypothetical protein
VRGELSGVWQSMAVCVRFARDLFSPHVSQFEVKSGKPRDPRDPRACASSSRYPSRYRAPHAVRIGGDCFRGGSKKTQRSFSRTSASIVEIGLYIDRSSRSSLVPVDLRSMQNLNRSIRYGCVRSIWIYLTEESHFRFSCSSREF